MGPDELDPSSLVSGNLMPDNHVQGSLIDGSLATGSSVPLPLSPLQQAQHTRPRLLDILGDSQTHTCLTQTDGLGQ